MRMRENAEDNSILEKFDIGFTEASALPAGSVNTELKKKSARSSRGDGSSENTRPIEVRSVVAWPVAV